MQLLLVTKQLQSFWILCSLSQAIGRTKTNGPRRIHSYGGLFVICIHYYILYELLFILFTYFFDSSIIYL